MKAGLFTSTIFESKKNLFHFNLRRSVVITSVTYSYLYSGNCNMVSFIYDDCNEIIKHRNRKMNVRFLFLFFSNLRIDFLYYFIIFY